MVFYTVLILIFIHYISEAHSSVSWLDQVVCTGTSNRKIVSCSILDDLAFSDHIPLKIIYSYSCDADINNVPQNESACNTIPSVNWSSATDAQLLGYNLLSDILLSSTNINVDTFACNDEQCCNADHHSDIDSLYIYTLLTRCSILVNEFLAQMNVITIGLSLAGTSMLLNSMPRQEVVM